MTAKKKSGWSNKTVLAKKLGIARSTLYYKSKKKKEDERLRDKINEVLDSNPSYGHKRIANVLNINKKRILRVMNKFGLKPKMCWDKRFFKPGDIRLPEAIYQNEIKDFNIDTPNKVWAGDFTYIRYKSSFIYLATVIDLYTKEIIGFAVSQFHNRFLVKSALIDAIKKRGQTPQYFHSDQGSEYRAEDYVKFLNENNIAVSMSKKASPWQNGVQESFYSQFKLELGNPNRFQTENHLCEAIYRQLYYYNHIRIHSSLKMPPTKFYTLFASGRN